MSTMQAPAGNLEPTRVLLTTSNANLLTAEDGRIAISKIRLVNVTNGAVTVDLEVYDGTTSYMLLNDYSIAANSYHEWYDDILPRGHILKGLASSNNAIWAHILASLPTKPIMNG